MIQPIRFNETHRQRTAAELEQHCGGRIVVLPLAAPVERGWRYVTVRVEHPNGPDFCEFDNHPYVRRSPFAEPVWLCDHAGRAGKDQRGSTHIPCLAGTRLEALLRAGELTAFAHRTTGLHYD